MRSNVTERKKRIAYHIGKLYGYDRNGEAIDTREEWDGLYAKLIEDCTVEEMFELAMSFNSGRKDRYQDEN